MGSIRLPTMSTLVVAAAGGCAAVLLSLELLRPAAAPSSGALADSLQRIEARASLGRAAIPEFDQELSDPDAKVRRNALIGLARVGPNASDVLPGVVVCLADSSAEVRRHAISAVWCISGGGTDAAKTIAPLLADADPEVARAAARALQAIGSSAVESVVPILRHHAAPARTRAISVLLGICSGSCEGAVAEEISRLVDDPDPESRLAAAAARVEWGIGSNSDVRLLLHAKETWVESTGSAPGSRPAVDIALDALGRAEKVADEFLPDLLVLIDDQDPAIVAGSRLHKLLLALGSLGDAARPAVPRLISLVDAVGNSPRLAIAETIWRIGAESAEVCQILVPLLEDFRSGGVDARAAKLLMRVSPDEARRQVSRLAARIIRHGTVDTCALRVLCNLAPQGREAVPLLVELLDHSDRHVLAMAIRSLAEIGPDAAPAIPKLISLLEAGCTDGDNRALDAALALAAVGPVSRSNVPRLLAILDAPDRPSRAGDHAIFPRDRVLDLVQQAGEWNDAVASSTEAQFASEWPSVRTAAVRALVGLAANSERALDAVRKHLRDENAAVRAIAALAAADLRGNHSQLIEELADALDDANPAVRTAAAIALGKFGPNAKSALPALRKAAQGESAAEPNAQFWQSLPHGQRPQWSYLIRQLDNLSIAGEAPTLMQIKLIDGFPAAKVVALLIETAADLD